MTHHIFKTISVGKQEINHNPFRVSLTERRDGQEIPRNMEIAAIKLGNFNPDMLDELSIYIGGCKILSFEGNEINNIRLPKEGILVSKCIYHCVDIYFHFNKKYIKDRSTILLENEYETEEVDTHELVYVRNPETGKVFLTNVVEVNKKPTGRKIEIVETYPVIQIPDIELTLVPQYESAEKWIDSIIWQKYLVTPEYDTWKYIKSLVERFELQMIDGTSVEEHYQAGKPFYARIQNKIRYNGEMAGLAYAL